MKFEEFKKKCLEIFGNAKEWITANRKIAYPMGAVILVALVIIIVLIAVPKGEEASNINKNGSGADSITNAIPVPEAPLEENAYPAVNSLMSEYFKALEDADLDTIRNLKSYIEPAEEIRIQKKKEFIESYENITCYTKLGPMEDSYLVYVYVEAKFKDIETMAPGLYTYFVCKKEDGGYWIMDGEMDNNITEYFKAISSQEDVEDLFNKVKVKYNDAIDSDEELKVFAENLPSELKSSVGEALAALEAGNQETAQEEPESEPVTETAEAEPETETAQEAEQTPEYVKAKDIVNVRSSDSETADKIGKVQTGTVMKLYENRANGWSKVDFEGREAYIKTEFLEASEAPAAGEAAGNTPAGENAGNTASNGTVRVKTTVNIRASANESGNKLGVAYEGDNLELLMKQADGWTKVKYNGQTGYVKSEFLE